MNKTKVVVVTGASRGIGQTICVAFAKEGATVVGVARSDLADTGAAVKAAGGTFVAHNADLGTGTQKESHDVIAQILAKTGQIEVRGRRGKSHDQRIGDASPLTLSLSPPRGEGKTKLTHFLFIVRVQLEEVGQRKIFLRLGNENILAKV